MRFYRVTNTSEKTISGTTRRGKPFVLSPNGQDGDTKWLEEEDLIYIMGLDEEGNINISNISISATADFAEPITVENANIDIDSDELANAIHNINMLTSTPSVVSKTVSTTAVLLAVGSSTMSGRKLLEVFNNSSSIIYIGPSSVTTSNGIPLLPNDRVYLPISADVYAIAASGSNDVRIAEYK